MLEQLFGIQYTGSVDGNVFGYYLDGKGGATAHLITPTGREPIGKVDVSAGETVYAQGQIVKGYVDHYLYCGG